MTNKLRIERSAEKLARFFHDTYEHHAKAEGWNTQQDCKVEFDSLPETNRRTMIKTCMDVLDALEASTPQATDAAECAQLINAKAWEVEGPLGHHVFSVDKAKAIIQAFADAQVAKALANLKHKKSAAAQVEDLEWNMKMIEDNGGNIPDYMYTMLEEAQKALTEVNQQKEEV